METSKESVTAMPAAMAEVPPGDQSMGNETMAPVEEKKVDEKRELDIKVLPSENGESLKSKTGILVDGVPKKDPEEAPKPPTELQKKIPAITDAAAKEELESSLGQKSTAKGPISQHAAECLRRLKGHRAPRGKRKVEFITDPAKRASTFSTLRQTIMRKLGELEVKCDAKILIAFHSHKKHVKTYAYGLNNWSSNKSNFDKVCQQTFYDRPCAPEGQDPLAEKARDELRSIYRSLMQRFCQGKNPGYGKPNKCPQWMPSHLWIMVDKMKPDQLREAIRKVEGVIKEEHNSKVPRSTPTPPPVGSMQRNMFSQMPPSLQGGPTMLPSPRDLHLPVQPGMSAMLNMHPSQRGHHMMKDSMFPHQNQAIFNAGMMTKLPPPHNSQPNQNFPMRPPVPQHVMQGGQVNPHHGLPSGSITPGQMTPGIQTFGGKKPQPGQQPRIDLDDSEDMKESGFSNQAMLQNKMMSPSLALLSPNFQLKSPQTPGFNKKMNDFKEWEENNMNKHSSELQSHYNSFANAHAPQMPAHISQGFGGMQPPGMMDRIPQHPLSNMPQRGNTAHQQHSMYRMNQGSHQQQQQQHQLMHSTGPREFKVSPNMQQVLGSQSMTHGMNMQQSARSMPMHQQMGSVMQQMGQQQAQQAAHNLLQLPIQQKDQMSLRGDGPPTKKQKV